MASLISQIESLDVFDAASIKNAIKAVQKETGHKGEKPVYASSCRNNGATSGPELPAAIALIGKGKAIERIGKYAAQ